MALFFLVCHPQDLQCPHLEAPFHISTGATASQSVGVYYGGSIEDGKQPRSAKRSPGRNSYRVSATASVRTLCARDAVQDVRIDSGSARRSGCCCLFFSLRLLILCQTRRQLQSGVESILIKVISLRTLGVRATDDDTNKNMRRDRYSTKGCPVVKLRDPACAGIPPSPRPPDAPINSAA